MKVFLNVVLDDAVEEKAGGEKVRLGMVVRWFPSQMSLGAVVADCCANIGDTRQFRCHVGGDGANWGRQGQRIAHGYMKRFWKGNINYFGVCNKTTTNTTPVAPEGHKIRACVERGARILFEIHGRGGERGLSLS